jgi:hypothetical protein
MRRSAAFPIVLALAAIMLASGAQAQDAREEGPIEIHKCQTISQPGSYKLVNNLTFKGLAGGTCLSITANFVTIDLAGFAITATGISQPSFPFIITTTAIGAGDSTKGITVRNGSISGDFEAGVSLGGDGSTVEGLRVSDLIGGVGIFATGIVRGNTAVGIVGPGPGNGTGISATGVVAGNYVSGNRGLGIFAEQGSTVIGNTATNTLMGSGIVANCPSNVIDNTATGNAGNLVLNGTGCNNTNNVAP